MELKLGHKQSDVGWIPEDWRSVRLSEISEFITKGSTPTTYGFKWDNDGILFLRSECVGEEGLDLRQSMFISPEAHAMLRRSEVRDGDLLITITGNVGRVVRVVGLGVANINQHVARVRVTASSVETQFVSHYLSQRTVRDRFNSITTGQAYPQISLEQVRNTVVPLPGIAEQRAIASALSDVDALIAKLDQLIAKKRDLKQAAMQQLLTGKTRLPGFSGKWAVRRLGDHVTFLRNGVNSRAELTAEGAVKYLHYGDIHTSDRLLLDPATVVMPCLPEPRARNLDRLHSGDLVFVDASEDLEGVGKSVEISCHSSDQLVAGLHTIAARFDRAVLADGFKAYLQFCPDFLAQLRRLAAGTKVYATNRAHIASVEMALPGTAEQAAIATVLSDMDAEIQALEARRGKTRAGKQGMMQVLLTGQVRLPVSTEQKEALA